MSAHAPTTGKSGVVDAATPVRTKPALLELQRSLDHFERQFSFISVSRLVLAPSPAFPSPRQDSPPP